MFQKLAVIFALTSGALSWNYNDPEAWPGLCSTGQRQSPIDLLSVTAVRHFPSFNLVNYDDIEVFNQYHAKFDPHGTLEIRTRADPLVFSPRLLGAGLPTTYNMTMMAWRFGADDSSGAEHQIDGQKSAMELQIISKRYDMKLSYHDKDHDHLMDDHEEADNRPQTYVILAFLFKISDEHNSALDPIISASTGAKQSETVSALRDFTLNKLVESVDLSRFYRYDGSFTVPPCLQSASWFVFADALPVSREQMATLRENAKANQDSLVVDSAHHRSTSHNFYRPLQDSNYRKVNRSWREGSFYKFSANESAIWSRDRTPDYSVYADWV